MAFATTRLSSKGQIVIPEQVREDLGLKEGMQFMVMGQGDTIFLRAIIPPSKDEFEKMLDQAQGWAKKSKLRTSDVQKATGKVRRQR